MGNDLTTKFRNGYRSVFQFGLRNDESVESVAEHYVRDWLGARLEGADQDSLDRWDGAEDVTLADGSQVEAVWYEDDRNRRNAVRYRVTEKAAEGHYRVSVSVMSSGGRDRQVVFLIEVSRDFGDEMNASFEIDPPRIVANILDSRKVFDGDTRLQGQPRSIRRQDVDELLDAVRDRARVVPLVIASSVSIEADEQWRSVIRALTRKTIGTAAVYAVSADAVDTMNSHLPEVLQAERGHVRIIAPRVDMDNPVVRRHPLWTPDDLTAFLDSDAQVTKDAASIVAQGPRARLLESTLPPEVRRIVQLLDQEERKRELSKTVDKRVADVSLQQEGEPDLVQETLAASGRAFPSRSEVHRKKEGGDDFWGSFQALLARWLAKDRSEVTEKTVEDDLHAIDQIIIRDREALEVNEQFLEGVETQRDELRVKIAELRETNDSLEVQLETEKQVRARLEEQVDSLRNQLQELSIKPVEEVERSEEPRRLGELQEKISRVDLEDVDPRVEVGEALQLLSKRLDPIIHSRLEGVLGGREWTEVLEKIDEKRGRKPGIYRRNDPAAQLRMLTEQIGKLGFPFEVDQHRTVSNLGGQLRAFRNRWSHHDELEVMDAVRAYDATHLLLENLGDPEGSMRAHEKREAILAALGAGNGNHIGAEEAPVRESEPPSNAGALVEEETSEEDASSEETGPSEDAVPMAYAEPHLREGAPYVPWEVSKPLPTDDLDGVGLPSKRQQVQEVVESIVAFEQPVLLDRLIRLVALQFGVSRVYKARRRRIKHHISHSEVFVDEDGYVWSRETDPATWGTFRPTPPGSSREFTQISPVEVRNAALFVLQENPDIGVGDLEYVVLDIFDRHVRTAVVLNHLEEALGDTLL